MKIIGIGYKRRRGKDTFAAFLFNALSNMGYTCKLTSFAEPLKRHIATGIFGLTRAQTDGDEKELVDPYWDMAPREILQKAGTECFRKVFGDDFWIRCLWRYLVNTTPTDFAIIRDVRFMNEAMAVKRRRGILIAVHRYVDPDPAIDMHPSETELDRFTEWDFTVNNIGSLEDLQARAIELAEGVDLLNA